MIVGDVNDENPRFNSSIYYGVADRRTKVGQPILRVDAKDKDQGKNGHVLYRIRENTHKHLLGLYAIDKVTGVVSLKRRVEVRLEFRFRFTCKSIFYESTPSTKFLGLSLSKRTVEVRFKFRFRCRSFYLDSKPSIKCPDFSH